MSRNTVAQLKIVMVAALFSYWSHRNAVNSLSNMNLVIYLKCCMFSACVRNIAPYIFHPVTLFFESDLCPLKVFVDVPVSVLINLINTVR